VGPFTTARFFLPSRELSEEILHGKQSVAGKVLRIIPQVRPVAFHRQVVGPRLSPLERLLFREVIEALRGDLGGAIPGTPAKNPSNNPRLAPSWRDRSTFTLD